MGKRVLPLVSIVTVIIIIAIFVSPKAFAHKSLHSVKAFAYKFLHSDQAFVYKPVSSSGIDLDPDIDSYLKSVGFNGTALVVKDNKVILNKGYGYSNAAKGSINQSQTEYYLASISKVFVSTSIMQLQDKGVLNIHDPLSKYIPAFPNGNKIALYNLLTHTSSIVHSSLTSKKMSHDSLIKQIEATPLLGHDTGTFWEYSDWNYSILAYILEKETHQSLEQYVQSHIFSKLGMIHSGFGNFPGGNGYIENGGKLYSANPLPEMSQLFGSGDIYSTAYDMYLFDKSLYSGELFSKNDLTVFFKPYMHHYGLGIYRETLDYVDHGVLPGWNAINSFDRKGETYVILFSNVQNGQPDISLIKNHIYNLIK